jgi:putative PIN family toxin of toxin-antitoxin system
VKRPLGDSKLPVKKISTGSSMPRRPKSRRRRLRVVFDTNIFVSAILFGGAPRLCLETARAGEFELIASRTILFELANALREKFRWSEEDINDVIVGLSKFVTVVQPTKKLAVIKEDPDDNRILDAAAEARANFIVSGDKKHILSLKKFHGIKILSASEFLKLL